MLSASMTPFFLVTPSKKCNTDIRNKQKIKSNGLLDVFRPEFTSTPSYGVPKTSTPVSKAIVGKKLFKATKPPTVIESTARQFRFSQLTNRIREKQKIKTKATTCHNIILKVDFGCRNCCAPKSSHKVDYTRRLRPQNYFAIKNVCRTNLIQLEDIKFNFFQG